VDARDELPLPGRPLPLRSLSCTEASMASSFATASP
jgi:hypothetical protein